VCGDQPIVDLPNRERGKRFGAVVIEHGVGAINQEPSLRTWVVGGIPEKIGFIGRRVESGVVPDLLAHEKARSNAERLSFRLARRQ
jgi:hypothetical protein